MSLLLLGAGLVVVAVVAAVVTGRLDASLPDPVSSSPHRALPPGRVAAESVDDLRFSLAVRGYRMDEVDEVLDRLRGELADRDATIDELLRAGGGTAGATGVGGVATAADALAAATGPRVRGTGELTAAGGTQAGDPATSSSPAAQARHGRRARASVGED